MYWLKFYENGAFCSVIGNAHETLGTARLALASFALEFTRQGFKVTIDTKCDTLTYDRYGTPCAIKIEEAEECS